jgi:recombinational DNA repair protein RecT
MLQTIIGQSGLIDVDYIAGMLRSLAPRQIDKDKVNWWAKAERAIELAKNEAAKNGGSIASAELLSSQIFEWAMSERIELMRASK